MRHSWQKRSCLQKNKKRAGGVAMEEKLYELMDWREIEAVVYSEEKNPGK